MVLFWVTVPLMALAVAWAVGVVLLRSVREQRRLRAESLATGQVEVPEDDTTRVVVETKPSLEARTRKAVHTALREGGGVAMIGRTDVTLAANDRHIVVSVPSAYAQRRTIERIVDHLNDDYSVEGVQVIPPKHAPEAPTNPHP